MDAQTQSEVAILASDAERLSSLGQHLEAEPLYRKIIDITHKYEGPDATYRDQYNLSNALVKQKKFKEAEPILKDVLAFLTQRPAGRDTPHFIEQEDATRKLLLQALEGQGKLEEAKETL